MIAAIFALRILQNTCHDFVFDNSCYAYIATRLHSLFCCGQTFAMCLLQKACNCNVLMYVFNEALKQLASSIILCHNHPSGNLKPSQADIDLTRKIKTAGKTLDISVLDHLIVSEKGFYSFADEGMM